MYVEEFEVASQKLVNGFTDLFNHWLMMGLSQPAAGVLDPTSDDWVYRDHDGPLNDSEIQILDDAMKSIRRELFYATPIIKAWKDRIISSSPSVLPPSSNGTDTASRLRTM